MGWLWFIIAATVLPAHAGVVDRVAYVVETELVLTSEIRLEEALASLDTSPIPFWEPTTGTAGQRLVDAATIRALIGELGLYQPTREAVSARREAIRARFDRHDDWEQFLQRWGLDQDGLEVVLRRRMLVERYFARNLLADPSDRERWLTECEANLAKLRPRVGTRAIPARGDPS